MLEKKILHHNPIFNMLINHILKQIVIDFFLMELLSSFEKWVLKLIKKKKDIYNHINGLKEERTGWKEED
jgi:hypothetical protein